MSGDSNDRRGLAQFLLAPVTPPRLGYHDCMPSIGFVGPGRGLPTHLALRAFGHQISWHSRASNNLTRTATRKVPNLRVIWLGPLGHIRFGRVLDFRPSGH